MPVFAALGLAGQTARLDRLKPNQPSLRDVKKFSSKADRTVTTSTRFAPQIRAARHGL